MNVDIYHVNAFTAEDHGGNPAGVVFDADQFSESQMLAIAQQVGFSETAFICDSQKATKRLRFFTPTGEVDLCGHATIASWSLLRQRQLVTDGLSTQETLAGLLKVRVRHDGLVYMEQTGAEFYETFGLEIIAPLLGVETADFNQDLRPQIVSTGLKDLMVVVKDDSILNSVRPDLEAIAAYSKSNDITGIHVAALSNGQTPLAFARNFAPLFGIDEESATGTSNGALLCYFKEHGVLPRRDEYMIEQGRVWARLHIVMENLRMKRSGLAEWLV